VWTEAVVAYCPREKLVDFGYEIIPYVLAEPECRLLAEQVRSCGVARAGARNLLMHQWCRELALRLKRHFGIERRLPPDAVAVQCTLFDKSEERNWRVTLHQDLSVPVRERVDSEACRGWSHKDGMIFVQPPMSVLEGLLAARLHLDDCAEGNGALRVVPGSHRYGRLSVKGIEAFRMSHGEVVCTVPRGGVMLMRPLLLHASSKAIEPGPRRVLHFVFGRPALPEGLRWAFN
jgi:Phytanoyl-CoA dioxygenase (PhyH)